MARSFWQGILAYVAGAAIGFILVSIFLKIGWENKERVLIMGYGGLTTVVIFYITFSSQIKQKEIAVIDEKINKKADLKELEKIDCKVETMRENIEYMVETQKETHATVENIYQYLLKGGIKNKN